MSSKTFWFYNSEPIHNLAIFNYLWCIYSTIFRSTPPLPVNVLPKYVTKTFKNFPIHSLNSQYHLTLCQSLFRICGKSVKDDLNSMIYELFLPPFEEIKPKYNTNGTIHKTYRKLFIFFTITAKIASRMAVWASNFNCFWEIFSGIS